MLSKDCSKHVTDEKINTITHLAGAIFSIPGTVFLIVASSEVEDPWAIVSFAIYGLSLLLLFSASMAHHGINASKKIEKLLRTFDYIAIFPLIAGTFTPLCLLLERSAFAWSIFGVIWGLSALGITFKAVFPNLPKWVFGTLYICMGWMGVFLAGPVLELSGVQGFALLMAGALCYSVGFVIFNIEKPNPLKGKFGFHEIWHILVLLGAFFHYLMMFFAVLPYVQGQ